MGTAKVHINRGKLEVVVGGMAKRASKRAAEATQRRAMNNIVSSGLVNTGELLHSIKIKDTSKGPLHPQYTVYSDDPAAKYPEFGRRGFSAAPGKVLAFKPKGSSVVVFTKKVGPVKPYRYMRRARASISARDYLI
jgi:hypothetical protein